MSAIPGVVTQTLVRVQVRLTGFGAESGKPAVLDKTTTDSGATPTNWIRPGLVVVKLTSTGKYFAADAATGDRNASATTTSLVDISAWSTGNKTFKWKYKGGVEHTVTGTSGDAVANAVTDLNADENFNADLVASASANKLVITARRAGRDEWFTITDGTLNDVGGAEATFADDTDHSGTDADYAVFDGDTADLKDATGTACDAMIVIFPRGEFKTDNLRSLTAEARAVLARNGSLFK